MKKLLTVFLFFLATMSFAQFNEGYISYDMKMEGMPSEEGASMMGDMKSTIYVKSGKTLSEVSSKMFSMKSLNDGTETLVVMDLFGQKKYYRKKNIDLAKEKENTPQPKIEYKEEKKMIAGYECKKAIVHIETENGKSEEMEVWYTEKLYNPSIMEDNKLPLKGLKGIPLEYNLNMSGMKMKMVAKEVSTKVVSDSKFVLSTDGYTEMNPAEMQGHQD